MDIDLGDIDDDLEHEEIYNDPADDQCVPLPILLSIDDLINIQKKFLFDRRMSKIKKEDSKPVLKVKIINHRPEETEKRPSRQKNDLLKSWDKLSMCSKIGRINEYVDQLGLDVEQTSEMKFDLINCVKSKIPVDVDYDHKVGTIICIRMDSSV